MSDEINLKRYRKWTWILSIGIPLVVVFLFSFKIPNVKPLYFLPPIYATINAFTALILMTALIAIKNNKIQLHQKLMITAILFSALFLIMYVAYHMTSTPTPYGGNGTLKYIYYFILSSHILLSVAVIPLVLVTYFRARALKFELHRRIARITFPIWLYVTISGVVVYLLISPYYG